MLRFFAICFFVLVVSAFNIKAQTAFRKGYVINKSRDTIWGQIEYRTNTKNYSSCIFKNEEVVEYFPQDIIGYGFVDDKFYSIGIVEGAFAEVLVVGDLSLYKCRSKYYLRKNKGKIFVLERKDHKEVRVDGKIFFDEDNRWKGVFYFLISDRISDNSIVKRIEFNERALVELVVKYNSFGKEKYKIFKESKPWCTMEIAVSVGVNNSKLSYCVESGYAESFKDKYVSIYPSLGFLLDIKAPRVSERVYFSSGLYYNRLKNTRYLDHDEWGEEYTKMKVDISSFTLPVLVKFDIYKKDMLVYAQGGLAFDYNFKRESKLFTERTNDYTPYTSSGVDMLDVNTFRFGYNFGLGVKGNLGNWKLGALIGYTHMPNIDGLDVVNANIDKIMFSVLFYL